MIQSFDPTAADPTIAPSTIGKHDFQEGFRNHVRTLLGQMYPEGRIRERRRDNRFPYPQLIRMTPCDAEGRTTAGEEFVVVGRHLSEGGLGFFHPAPIADRYVVAQLDLPNGESLRLLMDLTWCRFKQAGWYDSGGQFLRVVEQTNLPVANAS